MIDAESIKTLTASAVQNTTLAVVASSPVTLLFSADTEFCTIPQISAAGRLLWNDGNYLCWDDGNYIAYMNMT